MANAKGADVSGGSGYMAPELRVERERSDLVLEELTNMLDGGQPITEMRRRMSECVKQHYPCTVYSFNINGKL